MAQDWKAANSVNWLEGSGLPHIFRTLGFAVQPTKLGLALAAILLTLLFGWALDAVWDLAGHGISENAVGQFIRARQLDVGGEAAKGDRGIFATFRRHEQEAIHHALSAAVPGLSLSGVRDGGLRVAYGVWWMVREHSLYALLFFAGSLLIWSAFGGAMCRMTALHFARDDRLSVTEAMRFARQKLLGGLFLAPCIPLAFMVITALLMILGGALLRLPLLGDLICGLSFFLAPIGGFVIAILLLGLAVGGPLMWPAVAVEGSDAFDAFSRSLSYPFSKPWKTVLYGLLMFAYAGVCWLFVSTFTHWTLRLTHAVVSFGTSPFGWWGRGGEGQKLSKLELLWPVAGPQGMYAFPDWSRLAWYEFISAALIGISVLIVIGLMWSFLVSFFFSGSTVLYYLLRRDVDGIDLEDTFVPEPGGEPFVTGSATPTGSGTAPIAGGPTAAATPAAGGAGPAPTPGT